jgi:hypothetical protein
MRKLSNDFYRELHKLRDLYGETEYSQNDILPAAMSLVEGYLTDGSRELLRDVTKEILDKADKSDDRSVDGLFDYDGHIALGDKRRIKRGAMNGDQHRRRQKLINANYGSQHAAWFKETKWIDAGLDVLQEYPATTKRRDVLPEEATARRPRAAE